LVHLPIGVQAVFIIVAALTTMLGFLCLWLPIPPGLRLPKVDIAATLRQYQTYTWLIFAEAVGKLGGFLEVLYITWFLLAGWSRETIAGFFFVTGAIAAISALCFCLLLTRLEGVSTIVLAVFALCTFPPTLLGMLGIASSPRMSRGESDAQAVVMAILALAIVLSRLKQMAASLLKLFSLPSRWTYITSQAHSALILYGFEALSPLLVKGLSQAWDLPLATSGDYAVSDVFAISSLLLSIPFLTFNFLISLYTLRVAAKESTVPWHRVLVAQSTAQETWVQRFKALARSFFNHRRKVGLSAQGVSLEIAGSERTASART